MSVPELHRMVMGVGKVNVAKTPLDDFQMILIEEPINDRFRMATRLRGFMRIARTNRKSGNVENVLLLPFNVKIWIDDDQSSEDGFELKKREIGKRCLNLR